MSVRTVTDSDPPALLAIRNTPELFEEYLAADADVLRFLVFVKDAAVLGFARLKLPCAGDINKKRPIISDICISADQRSNGLGSALEETEPDTTRPTIPCRRHAKARA